MDFLSRFSLKLTEFVKTCHFVFDIMFVIYDEVENIRRRHYKFENQLLKYKIASYTEVFRIELKRNFHYF